MDSTHQFCKNPTDKLKEKTIFYKREKDEDPSTKKMENIRVYILLVLVSPDYQSKTPQTGGLDNRHLFSHFHPLEDGSPRSDVRMVRFWGELSSWLVDSRFFCCVLMWQGCGIAGDSNLSGLFL